MCAGFSSRSSAADVHAVVCRAELLVEREGAHARFIGGEAGTVESNEIDRLFLDSTVTVSTRPGNERMMASFVRILDAAAAPFVDALSALCPPAACTQCVCMSRRACLCDVLAAPDVVERPTVLALNPLGREEGCLTLSVLVRVS